MKLDSGESSRVCLDFDRTRTLGKKVWMAFAGKLSLALDSAGDPVLSATGLLPSGLETLPKLSRHLITGVKAALERGDVFSNPKYTGTGTGAVPLEFLFTPARPAP
jgi:hypothetical protein